MKKILTIIVLCGLLFGQLGMVWANDNIDSSISKQLIISKNNLSTSVKNKKYIQKIDIIVNKLSIEKLEKLSKKLEKIPTSVRENKKYKDILDYLEAQVLIKISQKNVAENEESEVLTGTVTIDTNHALAGKVLIFDVELVQLDKAQGNNNTDAIENGDDVEVHYIGILQEDGSKFDSSYDRDITLPFTVGGGMMIPGFDAGVVGMKLGSKRTLTLQPKDAYGEYDPTNIQEIPKADLESFVDAGFKLEVGESLPTQFGLFKIIKVSDK